MGPASLLSRIGLDGCEAWLFALNFTIFASNSLVMPVREALILHGGKQLQQKLMFASTGASTLGTLLFSWCAEYLGGHRALHAFLVLSGALCAATWAFFALGSRAPTSPGLIAQAYYLYYTFWNMTSASAFWVVAGDFLSSDAAQPRHCSGGGGGGGSRKFMRAFGRFAAGGTLGQMVGSSLSSALAQAVGSTHSLLAAASAFAAAALLMRGLVRRYPQAQPKSQPPPAAIAAALPAAAPASPPAPVPDPLPSPVPAPLPSPVPAPLPSPLLSWLPALPTPAASSLGVVALIARDRLLSLAFCYSVLLSMCLGLFVIERQAVAQRAGVSTDEFASLMGLSLLGQGVAQFGMQYLGTSALTAALGTRLSCALSALGRLALFSSILALQLRCPLLPSGWADAYFSPSRGASVVAALLAADVSCRVLNHSASKPLKESLWTLVPPHRHRYTAKLVIDVFAHRLGTTAAASLSRLDLTALLPLPLPLPLPLSLFLPVPVPGIVRGSAAGTGTGTSTGAGAGASASAAASGLVGAAAGGADAHTAWGLAASAAFVCVALALGACIDARSAAKEEEARRLEEEKEKKQE